MNIFKKFGLKIKGLFKSETSSQWQNLITFLGLDNESTKTLSEATYYACLKVLSEAIGKLPLKLQCHDGKNGVLSMREHPLYYVVHDRPNPYMTSTTFWSTMEWLRNHKGNAYAWIKGYGKDTTLWILPSDDVEVWYDDACILSDIPDIYYLYSVGGKIYRFGSDEIIHLKASHTKNGVTGIAVKDTLKETVSGNIKAQKLTNKMYDSGFTGKATLQYTGSLSEQNQKTFTAGIQQYLNGELKSEGIENIIPLPYGAVLQPLNLKLSDNQFLEVKQYTALQIASAFGIKPYQIGDYTKSSYASAEAQQLSFYIDTLLFIVKQYEEELTFKLLSRDEIAKGMYFKFNIDVILRADFATKINTLSTAVNSFLYTPNEARAKLDAPAVEGGDRLLGNGASIPVEATGSQYTRDSQEETPQTDLESPEEAPEENNQGEEEHDNG